MRRIGKAALALLVLAPRVGAVSMWRWTHTPFGPMDPGAALITHGMGILMSLGSGPGNANLPLE